MKEKEKIAPDGVIALRKSFGLRQRQCAELVGVSLRTWQAYEQPVDQKGHRYPTQRKMALFKKQALSNTQKTPEIADASQETNEEVENE